MIATQQCIPLSHESLRAGSWTGFAAEPKQDGMRGIVVVDDDGAVEIFSRNGKSQAGKFPDLELIFGTLPPGTVLDGEIAWIASWTEIAERAVPIVDFNQTMRIAGSGAGEAVRKQQELGGSISFILFDVLRYQGEELIGRPWLDRRWHVDTIGHELWEYGLIITNPVWHDHTQFAGIEEKLEAAGCEGMVIKSVIARYHPGARPTGVWYKVKKVLTFDVVIMGVTPGNGKYEGLMGAIEYGMVRNGELVRIGRCSGMTDEERAWITRHADELIARNAVLEIAANDLVGSGEYKTPRHPQFKGWRDDKNWRDCLIEQLAQEG